MLTFMSFEIDEFLSPAIGVLPSKSFTMEIVYSMKTNLEQYK